MARRIAFSGLLKSGKDYIAEQIGFKTLSFAEPLYAICKYVYGTCDKNNPRHRRFLQWLGQIGWGFHDEEQCPDDFNRAAMVILMRQEGHAIYPHRCWHEFGTISDFWVIDLLDRIRNFHSNENIAVVNVRFRHELEPMKAGGFEHYLVLCSEETRLERYVGPEVWNLLADGARKSVRIPPEIDNDKSEQLARALAKEMPDERIIWNDHRPMPGGKNYLTVEQFKKGL